MKSPPSSSLRWPIAAAAVIAAAGVLSVTAGAGAQPRFTLVTFGPGESIDERFGHTALRMTDGDEDLLYNFGHADFEASLFYLDIVQGEARFDGVVGDAAAELARYQRSDRSIRLQELNLEGSAALQLAETVRSEVGSGHFTYRYDYLHANCATEVRDLIDVASGGALRAHAERRRPPQGRPTFRTLLLTGLAGDTPMLLGVDLVGGPAQDHEASGWEELFVPARLHDAVATAPGLAEASITTYERRGPAVQRGPANLARIGALLLTVMLGALLLLGRRNRGVRRLAGAGLLGAALASTVVGVGVCFLIATSRLNALNWNENALVMWPTDLLLAYPAWDMLRGRTPAPSRIITAYLGLRLFALCALCFAQLAGWATQDNLTFIAATFVILGGTFVAEGGRPKGD